MRLDLRTNRGQRKFVDVTREGPPRFPGDPDIGPAEDHDQDANVSDSELKQRTTALMVWKLRRPRQDKYQMMRHLQHILNPFGNQAKLWDHMDHRLL